MIEARQLGRCGLWVPQLCLGTANFGWVTDADSASHIMSTALEAGVNFLDTADTYNRTRGDFASEILVGKWLTEDPSRRHRIVLTTKVYGVTGAGINDRGLSARHIVLACEESLRRLHTEWIDLYLLHHVDLRVPWEEIVDAVGRLIAQGKVLYAGTSNFAAWQLATLALTARERYMAMPVSEQSPYSLAVRNVESEVLPACQHLGLGFLAYSPLCGGLLAGPASGHVRDTGSIAERRRSEARRLFQWYQQCQAVGLTPARAALAWVLSRPGVTSAVIGPRTEAQLEDCIAAAVLHPDETTLNNIAACWPGPGTAPEAYAW